MWVCVCGLGHTKHENDLYWIVYACVLLCLCVYMSICQLVDKYINIHLSIYKSIRKCMRVCHGRAKQFAHLDTCCSVAQLPAPNSEIIFTTMSRCQIQTISNFSSVLLFCLFLLIVPLFRLNTPFLILAIFTSITFLLNFGTQLSVSIACNRMTQMYMAKKSPKNEWDSRKFDCILSIMNWKLF